MNTIASPFGILSRALSPIQGALTGAVKGPFEGAHGGVDRGSDLHRGLGVPRFHVPSEDAPQPVPQIRPSTPTKTPPGTRDSDSGGDPLMVADLFVRGYIDFLKSYTPNADPDAQAALGDRLVKLVSDPLGIDPSQIASFDISSETTLAAAFATQTGVGEDGVRTTTAAAAFDFQSHLRATIVTNDGTRYDVELDVSYQAQVAVSEQSTQQADPLVLDLNGDGVFSLSDVAGGVPFDLNGDGAEDRAAFAVGPDALLALDRNGNGTIDDGHELFGDQNGDANGFGALSQLDSDHNGQIDSADPLFQFLSAIRIGADGNFENLSLESLGIRSLGLAARQVDLAALGGNRLTHLGAYQTSDGHTRSLGDAMLGFRTLSTDA